MVRCVCVCLVWSRYDFFSCFFRWKPTAEGAPFSPMFFLLVFPPLGSQLRRRLIRALSRTTLQGGFLLSLSPSLPLLLPLPLFLFFFQFSFFFVFPLFFFFSSSFSFLFVCFFFSFSFSVLCCFLIPLSISLVLFSSYFFSSFWFSLSLFLSCLSRK